MRIEPDNNLLQYSGRIDFTDPKAPVFIFPCTYVKMKFTGSRLGVHIKNHRAYWDNYLGYFLDGKQGVLKLPEQGKTVLDISVEAAEEKEHEILLFKRQDACHEVSFYGFEIGEDACVLPLENMPRRKIEVYGDSVSAGEVSEALDYVGMQDPEHNGEYSNSWYSYAWITARMLNAQIHNIAQGGIALLDDTGWFDAPDYMGMESVWDKVHYHSVLGESTEWDFKTYTPDVVIVAVGQNDSHPLDYMKEDYNCQKSGNWRRHYRDFIRTLRKQYPKAWIILTTTILKHDSSWDLSIEQVCRELKDEQVRHFLYRRNGCGTPGHIRIPEAEEMAQELSAFIQKLDIKEWQEHEENKNPVKNGLN